MTDPLTTLVAHLQAGEAPPVAWVVEWLDGDGKFPRAWAVSKDLSAMRFVLGSPHAGVIGAGARQGVLRNLVSFVSSEEIFLQLAFGYLIGVPVRVVGMSRIGIPRVLGWALEASQFAKEFSRREQARIAERLRVAVEPPTLPALLRRLKIGTHAETAVTL